MQHAGEYHRPAEGTIFAFRKGPHNREAKAVKASTRWHKFGIGVRSPYARVSPLGRRRLRVKYVGWVAFAKSQDAPQVAEESLGWLDKAWKNVLDAEVRPDDRQLRDIDLMPLALSGLSFKCSCAVARRCW